MIYQELDIRPFTLCSSATKKKKKKNSNKRTENLRKLFEEDSILMYYCFVAVYTLISIYNQFTEVKGIFY